ncbi:MAG: hypothetical protein UEL03_02940 [Clostridium sp.]|nr:hypothetical protein [Clostridium sp.]
MIYIISGIFFLLYYLICLLCLNSDDMLKEIKKEKFRLRWKVILCFIIAFSAINVFVWIKKNRFVYYWDYSGYWTLCIDRIKYIFENPNAKILESLINSINNDDYNNFLPTITALPLKLVGYTFVRYVCLVDVLFIIPTAFVQGLIAIKVVKNPNLSNDTVFCLGSIISLLFSGNYYALMCGYIDVAILLPMSISVYLLLDYDFSAFNMKKNIAISTMLLMTWISRRYTIYFIVGYVVIFLVEAMFFCYKRKRNYFISIIKNYIFIGITCFSVLLILFPKFVKKVLLTNYKYMYSAYDSTLIKKVESLLLSFGIYSIIIVLVCVVLSLLYKQGRELIFCSLCIMAIECVTFWSTQAMGVQHRMILNVPMFIVYMLPLKYVGYKDKRRKKGSWLLALLSVFLIISNYCYTFVPQMTNVKEFSGFFSEKYKPLQRNDMDNLNELAEKLRTLTSNTNDHIYVSASGSVLNTDILRKLKMPYEYDIIPNLEPSCEVDLRDGFPTEFLHAKYIVTTDPIQLCLESGQEIVRYLASNVRDEKSYIGKHYQKIFSIELDNDCVASVYEKKSEYTRSDLKKIKTHFNEMYPNHPELFEERIY